MTLNCQHWSVKRLQICGLHFSLSPSAIDCHGIHHPYQLHFPMPVRRLDGLKAVAYWLNPCCPRARAIHNWPIVLHHLGEVPKQTMCKAALLAESFSRRRRNTEQATGYLLCQLDLLHGCLLWRALHVKGDSSLYDRSTDHFLKNWTGHVSD